MERRALQIREAANLAMTLMQQHGLEGWGFAFDRARRRFGACHPGRKLITLSAHLTQLNDEAQVRETILHEIAHALTPGDHHGAKWRAACVRIGAAPKRCYTEQQVVSPPRQPSRYLIGCRTCDWWADRRRLTRKPLVCGRCRKPVTYRHRATGLDFVMTRTLRGWSLQRG